MKKYIENLWMYNTKKKQKTTEQIFMDSESETLFLIEMKNASY